jgi:hypothetical protein
MSGSIRTAVTLSVAVFAMTFGGTAADAQKVPQDLPGKLSGTWVLNRELSTGFRAPAPGRGRGGAAYSLPPSSKLPRQGPRFATAALAQRGGGGGRGAGGVMDPTDLTPEDRAEQTAMRQLQQIDERITIKASVESVTFTDARGDRTFTVNDKSSKIDVGGTTVNVKSKWDKTVLKQEFSNTQAKLVQTWGVDDAGRLVLTAKLESMTLVTPERKAVFDRQ